MDLVSIEGKDDVNCDKAEEVGFSIQKSLDNLSLASASIKRKDRIKTLESLQHKAKQTGSVTSIDPKIMFNRLIAIAVREESLEPYFEYELTSEPMYLFKEWMMRKPDKLSLRKVIMPDEESIARDAIGQYSVSVVDGGALLHRVRWTKGKKFSDIGKAYVGNVSRYYQSPVIVFDGYEKDNTKSHEHLRRNSLPQMLLNHLRWKPPQLFFS